MRLTVACDFLPKLPTVRAAGVMDYFGIGLEQGRYLIAEELDLPIEPGDVVLFTGPSGSGKSSLMKAAAARLESGPAAAQLVRIENLTLGEELLIDSLPLDPIECMQLLAQCGLSEARLLLRRPAELSDGQQYRFRLASALALKPDWLVADEFTATLDRTLAKVIAFNLRRLADRTGAGFLLATTHEDIVDDLSPDVHVRCGLDGRMDVTRSPASATDAPSELEDAACTHEKKPGFSRRTRKKKASASGTSCGSARRPVATGRTSLGGITAVTSSR